MNDSTYLEELNIQMWSFTEAMTEAIDARTPYNGSHTRKVAEYSAKIVDYINKLHAEGKEALSFTEDHKNQIVMAALLHDIGKMVVPIEVMNKSTRLENHINNIESRLEKIGLLLTIDLLKEDISLSEHTLLTGLLNKAKKLVKEVNTAGILSDDIISEVEEVIDCIYVSKDKNTIIPFFTEEEKDCMRIQRGTLTEKERVVMESHVVMTERILSKVHFNSKFKEAPIWAVQHHEYLDGTGYPMGKKGDELCVEARILAVADICDALLAKDRPYKEPMPKKEAFDTMKNMAKEGKLDSKLVNYLEACI